LAVAYFFGPPCMSIKTFLLTVVV